MKRIVLLCAAILLVVASAVYAFGDLARPKPTTKPDERGKLVYHTGLTIATDPQAWEARLQISQETLNRIREATANTPANESLSQRVMNSSSRTIMAGLFMFLAVSFAGVWLARSSQRRTNKAVAAIIVCAAMLGMATVIVRANAGPPGYVRWQNLPANLTKGELTRGGLDIEIVPGDSGMKLIVPLKTTKKPDAPGEE